MDKGSSFNEFGLMGKIDGFVREDNLKEDAIKIVKKIKPEWKDEDIQTKEFSEGITNKIILIWSGERENGILVRVYGANTDVIIDRSVERRNIQLLCKVGCSKPLYATFDNGIAYGFIEGVTLDEETVKDPEIYRCICKEIIRFHSVECDGEKSAYIWTKTRMFIENMPEKFPEEERTKKLKEKIASKETLLNEMEMLQNELSNLDSPVCFCHNDLLLQNLIYNKEKNRVYFIDYEYGFYNYEAFDIANHFNEYAGVNEVDYSRYPDKEYQMKWLKTFLREKNGGDVDNKEVEKLYVQVNKFSLLSHFFWGVWALIQAANSSIDFDFLEYSIVRFGEYNRKKDEFLKLTL
ncbi:DgyrCDS777 [Dimorphilus gyrociliatus]|uniref:ethanolamine kinase n=1 Tax=Dimorphilus gyrociliatus TaxID=2664684 RepID=A0A7I8V7E6_9ANNE|nr:DgyrCDS777 [Dimorphilus gyrociliatus]